MTDQYEYLLRQYRLATHMELTEDNVMKVLEDLIPYIEADGGWLEFVEIEEETNFVKVRLGGACSTCLLYTSPSPRDRQKSRMPSSA